MADNVSELLQTAVRHHQAGAFAHAEAIYQQVLQRYPHHPDALHMLGLLAGQTGKSALAIELITKAISIQPTASMHSNLANTLHALKKYDAAIAHYQQAIALEPNYAEAYSNCGIALAAQGKLSAAVDSYRQAIALKPDLASAYNGLGSVLKAQGKLQAAVDSYVQAIALNPQFAEAYNNAGNALQSLGRLEEAVTYYRQAVAIKPNYTDVYSNLGNALQGLGQYKDAIASYRRALELEPNSIVPRSNLLFSLSFYPQCSPEQYVEEARRYGQVLLTQATPYNQWQVSDGQQRLRVGIVSGDLKTHPVGYFLESMLRHLNPARIELVAYTTQPLEDELTQRIKPRFARWQSLVGMSDSAAAQRIHQDQLHVLIDLAGHTAHNRLPVFAWQPAPVQVSWLGFFASTGVIGMDYIIADPLSVPIQNRAHFTEAVWYLPETRLCFTPPAPDLAQELTSLPALNNGYITFGCFQKLVKINDEVLTLWGRIFQALPHARLRLQSKQMNCALAREQLLQRLSSFGIARQQVWIAGEVPREAYLAAYGEVDIILDTFPFNGGTTTCEALWMGVPTLTLAGDTLLSRQGLSLLTGVGLHDWIALTKDDYVNKALSHAQDLASLTQLRMRLRTMMLNSVLVDAPRFAHHFEQALFGMWQQKRDALLSAQTPPVA